MLTKADFPNLHYITITGEWAPGTKFSPQTLTTEFNQLITALNSLEALLKNRDQQLDDLAERCHYLASTNEELRDRLRAAEAAASFDLDFG